MNSNLDDFDDDDFSLLSEDEATPVDYLQLQLDSSPYLQGDATQDDYDNIFSFTNRWKGWALIASPPRVGSSSRSKYSLQTLRQEWINVESKRKEENAKTSEFANQWKSVLLKYNQKLSKAEEEKSASQAVSDVTPFTPLFVDLRGLHSEEQILVGIWRQLGLPNAQNLAQLQQVVVGFILQQSKATLVVFDHVSKRAAAHVAHLFTHLSDLMGLLVIADMTIDAKALLLDYPEKDHHLAEHFTNEVSEFCGILKLPWDIATEKENERVLISSTTLTNRATKSLAANMLGYAPDTLFANPSAKHNLKSPSGFFDAQLGMTGKTDIDGMSLEQKAAIIESIEIVAELSDGIPGLIAALIHVELPVLRLLQQRRLDSKPIRTRLLSTSRYVNAGRVFVAVAKVVASLADVCLAVDKDRHDFLSVLHLQSYHLDRHPSWDTQVESCASLLCAHDLTAQGISDAFLASLVSKGFLHFHPPSQTYVIPSTVALVIAQLYPTTSEEEHARTKAFLFRQQCANLAHDFRHHVVQRWILINGDLRLLPVSVLQQHIVLRKLETLLPQLQTVIHAIITNEHSHVPLAHEDIVQGLFLLVTGGASVVTAWCSLDTRLTLLQSLASLIRSWTADDLKRSLTSTLQVVESSRHPAFTVHSLLLDTIALLQETALEWWWLSGADIFTPKHLSSRIRHVQAHEQRSQAMEIVALIGRLLAVSSQWITETATTSSLTTSSRTTASVFLQREHLLRAFKHRVLEAYCLSEDPLDRLQLPGWQALVDEYAVQLQALSAQTRAALDSLDLSHVDLDDELALPSAVTAETSSATAASRPSMRHLLDRLPATQRLLLSLKNHLKHRYDVVIASSTLQNTSSTSLTSLSSPSSASVSPEKAAASAHSPRKPPPSAETTHRLKAEETIKATKRMDLFELSIEHIEKAMLLRIASGLAELHEVASGCLLQLILRRYPHGVLKAAAVATTTLEGFTAPSASSTLALRGRLLFSASLIRSFSSSMGLPIILPATAAATTTPSSSAFTATAPMTLVGDTEEDQLLWTAYLQRLTDAQEGLSPTPWQSISSAMYAHPIVVEAEDHAMAHVHRLLAVAVRCMRLAHQEYEKLYQVVDLAFLDEATATASAEADEQQQQTDGASSTWRDTMALANISSVTIANAGIVYADLVASLTLMGGAYALLDTDAASSGGREEEEEDEEERQEAILSHITDARDICDDSVQIWSRVYSQYALQDALPRLVIGYAYYLLYELTMYPLQQSHGVVVAAERYLGLVYHQSLEVLTPAEAAQRLERHRHESQIWNLAFHYQAMAFRILRLLSWPQLHRLCLQQTTIRGLNDYQRFAQYQATLQRVLEPSRSGNGLSSTSLPTPIPLPDDVLDTMHTMIKALQHATQYEYHRMRRSLDEELLSYYALATTTAAAAESAATTAASATTRILDLGSVDGVGASAAAAAGSAVGSSPYETLTVEDLQQQHSVYALQLRLQQVAAQPLLLVYVARCYDSLIGGQSVTVPPLIATNVALPFVHPQQTMSASSTGSSGSSGPSGLSGSGSEVTSTGYDRAMDLYKYLMQQYRELSNLCYAKELWDDQPPPSSGRHRNGAGKRNGPQRRGAASSRGGPQPPSLTLWGHIVESVFPHPYDSFFHQPPAPTTTTTTKTKTAAATAATRPTPPPQQQRRKVVGGGRGGEVADPVDGHRSDSDADANAAGSDEDDDGDDDDNDEAVRLVQSDEQLFPSARRVLRLRESFPSLALRFADVLYLWAHAIYRDGLTRYKLAPQLHDEIAAPVFAQHVAAITAARQLYEQELTPRQYCPIALILVRQLAQYQQLQRDIDGAIRSYEELLRIFLETKFTSLLVLAEIYTEYGDALMAKKEFFHASLMYQMAIDHYRDYDAERPVGDEAGASTAAASAVSAAVSAASSAAAAGAKEAPQPQQPQERQRAQQLRGIAPAASSSSFALDGRVSFDTTTTTATLSQRTNTRTPLTLDYAWALYVPEHLHEASVTEELLQARVAWNLAAKAKALFAGEDFEQAQELAEQAQHLLALVMTSTVKVPDADVVKKEQHVAQRQRQRQGQRPPPAVTAGDDEAAAASLDAATDDALTVTVAANATATASAATAAQRRREQQERDDDAQDAQLRRVVVVSPVAVDVYLLLALVHYQFDEYDDAERYFHKAETAVHELGDAESLTMVKIYHNRGVLLQTRGDADDAKLFFEQALWLLRRRHANAFYQWQSTLEALSEVYETLQAAAEVEKVAAQRDELDLRLGTLALMQQERTRDLERLLQGLFAWEQEKQWRLKQWSEEEAAYQGFDDDGNVDYHDDDFDASSSDDDGAAAAATTAARRRRFSDGHDDGSDDNDDDGSGSGHEDGGGNLDARRGHRRQLRIQATLAASLSSSEGDPSSEDDDGASHGSAGDVGHGGDDDAAAARHRRRERRRQRRAKEARRDARRARRQAKAEALLRHRQRASQQQLSTPTQTSSSGKRGWSGANSPAVGPSSTSLASAASAASAASSPAPTVVAAAAASSASSSSWQEYLSAKRLHPVASVGVDRMTVGMLRRAFHVLRERAATDRPGAVALAPTTMTTAMPTSPTSPSSSAAALLPPKAAWPSVVVEPDGSGSDHRRGPSPSPAAPLTSLQVARPPPWQQLIRRQQHALFLGTQQLYSYDPDDDGDASPVVKTTAAASQSTARVTAGSTATAAAASTAKKPSTGGKRSSLPTTTTTASSAAASETTASDTTTASDADDDLPELPSGNCVVS